MRGSHHCRSRYRRYHRWDQRTAVRGLVRARRGHVWYLARVVGLRGSLLSLRPVPEARNALHEENNGVIEEW